MTMSIDPKAPAAEAISSLAPTPKESVWRTTLRWVFTIKGFLLTIYGLNIVAWGGMLFLLLCNAAPAMCRPDCNDINSPRRIWIEIDSQILNGLFCVTGFGLAPWRFRDLYYLLVWRLGIRGFNQERRERGLQKLADIHKGWFRLLEDQGTPTKHWKMDYVIWCSAFNTFFQCCLAGFMWGMNRYNRPSWTTGLFVGLAFGVAIMAGLQIYLEGRRLKKTKKGGEV